MLASIHLSELGSDIFRMSQVRIGYSQETRKTRKGQENGRCCDIGMRLGVGYSGNQYKEVCSKINYASIKKEREMF